MTNQRVKNALIGIFSLPFKLKCLPIILKSVKILKHASLAQQAEQGTLNPWVVGSIPTGCTKSKNEGLNLRFSIKIQNKKMAGVTGFEPITHGVEARCSTVELHSYKLDNYSINSHKIIKKAEKPLLYFCHFILS